MTAEQRSERHLTTILEDLYLGPAPMYRDEVMATAVHSRQRPAWTFPGRWIPMAYIASGREFAPRVPWRTIGVALAIMALLFAAALVFIGSHQTRVPAPFGLARNGQIATENHGDIVVTDLSTWTSTTVVPGFEADQQPMFSRDGTRLAFLRRVFDASGSGTYRLVVGRADGSDLRALPMPLKDTIVFEWAPDSRSLIAYDEPRVWRLDAVGSAPAVLISGDVVPSGRLGGRVELANTLYQPFSILEDALWIMDLDGSNQRELIRKDAEYPGPRNLSGARFSPDGTRIAFQQVSPNDTGIRIHVMQVDGSALRQLDNEPGTWFELDPAWSPDGKRVAFSRWQPDPKSDAWLARPVGVVSVDGGRVIDAGPTPALSGEFGFEWSPDGTTILLAVDPDDGSTARPLAIDPFSGTWRELPVDLGSVTNWQRLAP